MLLPRLFFSPPILTISLWFAMASVAAAKDSQSMPEQLRAFIDNTCLDCHSGEEAEAGLDLDALPFDLTESALARKWTLIHDRMRDGEMPPPVKESDGIPIPIATVGWSSRTSDDNPPSNAAKQALRDLGGALYAADSERIIKSGRAKVRRLNRSEYENKLRQVLDAPWLQIKDQLPEDAVAHLFNKVGERLDVSHVQMTRYLQVAEDAVRTAVNAAAHPSQTQKFYAREEPSMQSFIKYSFFQHSATRAIVPLLIQDDGSLASEVEIIRGKQPKTVGGGNTEVREREAMGTFCGTFLATTKYDFSRINAPTDGEYRIRFKTFTFRSGLNGASGGDDHGLTGGNEKWWRPNRNVVMKGERSEPVTLYALGPAGSSRWLTTFDSHPEPSIFECTVTLRKGEGIRPDASRLVRTRPGWHGNPNASKSGVPGFAMQWMEVEGPLQSQQRERSAAGKNDEKKEDSPRSYQSVFGDLPFEIQDGKTKIVAEVSAETAKECIEAFYQRVMANESPLSNSVDVAASIAPFVDIFNRAQTLGQDFTDAMVTTCAAMLCSPDLLYLDSQPGVLSAKQREERLAYFLWNGPPDAGETKSVDTMLVDPRSQRFIDSFLGYWLDLRDINANAPDAELYPDYYLDDLLTESSILETRSFFRELIAKDLPVRNLVQSNFVFVNERLAEHYGLPPVDGVGLRRVELSEESPRGGLMTQASVLRVTANGTTTSPVVRGAWIVERILGVDIPEPPSGVAAVDPDIRGAKTIREQLVKHRANESCNACHARFDGVGFALENFDVAGGWRERYRSIGKKGDAVEGLGKNGHAFKFKLAQSVEPGGTLLSGESFDDVHELKRMLAANERQLARNLLQQFIVYSTGAPVTFADRVEVESMLDRAKTKDYGVRTLIKELVESKIFTRK